MRTDLVRRPLELRGAVLVVVVDRAKRTPAFEASPVVLPVRGMPNATAPTVEPA